MMTTDEPPQSLKSIGDRLRITRDALGLNSREMAEICGIPQKTFSAYLRGQNLMKPDVAIKVIQKFPRARIDFNWLYQGDPSGLSHEFALKIEAVSAGKVTARAS